MHVVVLQVAPESDARVEVVAAQEGERGEGTLQNLGQRFNGDDWRQADAWIQAAGDGTKDGHRVTHSVCAFNEACRGTARRNATSHLAAVTARAARLGLALAQRIRVPLLATQVGVPLSSLQVKPALHLTESQG